MSTRWVSSGRRRVLREQMSPWCRLKGGQSIHKERDATGKFQ